MRPVRDCRAALPAGLALFLLIGCAAGPSTPPITHEAIVQLAKERQKTIDVAEEPPGSTMSDLTVADYERLGDQYLSRGHQMLAFVQYHRALRLDPHHSRIRDKLALLYVQKGLWQEAEAEFQRILDDDATYAQAHEGLGYVYLSRGRSSEAENSFWRAIHYNPGLWKSHAFLGLLYTSQGKYAEAAEEFQAALALKPTHQALMNNLGRAYYAMGRYDDAIERFRQALQVGPSSPQLFNNLGLALAKAGRFQEALDAFRNGGDLPKAYNNLGVMYWAANDRDKARACFQRAIEVDAKYEPPARNLAAVQAASRSHSNSTAKGTRSPCSSAHTAALGTGTSP